MAATVFAIQNDFALRYGPSCTSPTSFLALRLKGLQKNQPNLVRSYLSAAATSSSSASSASDEYGAPPSRHESRYSNTNSSPASYEAQISTTQQQRGNTYASHSSPSLSSAPRADNKNNNNYYDSHRYSQRSPSITTTTTDTTNYQSAGSNLQRQQQHQLKQPSPPTTTDVDSQPLPAPGVLSSNKTLAKALSTDPEAHVSPSEITMASCHICHRRFDVTRLERHITACQKSAAAAAKRKEFDAQELRVKKLYENDPLTAAKVLKQIEKEEELAASGKAPPKKSTWRKKSAELVNAVGRGAAAGGAAPIPVADDRVPCPGCGKKFAEETAARHIPICVERQKRSSFR